MASSSNPDFFESVYQELVNQYCTEDTGLLAGIRRLFLKRVEDSSSFHLAIHHHINDLEYWKFLRQMLIFFHNCSDAGKVVQNFESLFINFEAASDEITKELSIACRKRYILSRHPKALDVLRDSVAKLELFNHEIGEALQKLSGCSLVWQLTMLDPYLWYEILRIIKKILDRIGYQVNSEDQREQIWSFKEKMNSLRSFSGEVLNDHVGHDFFAYIASVGVRIANQSFHYWTNRTDSVMAESKIVGLLNLQRHIDPTAPEFLELNLKLLRALRETGNRKAKHPVDSYLGYMRQWVRTDELFVELKSLVIFVVNEPDESSETVQSFLAEIKALFTLAGSFYSEMEPHFPSSELQRKICLLKAEIFIQKQLKKSRVAGEEQIEEINQVLNKLRRFSKDLPRDKKENGKQTLALIKQVARDVSTLYESFQDKKVTKHRVRISLLLMLLKIVLFKAESSCMELMNGDVRLMAFGKDQIESLFEGLKLFTSFVNTQPGETTREAELIFTRIEAIARRVTVLSHSILLMEVTEEMSISFADLQDKMTLTKAEIRGICPQISMSDFPKTDGSGFVDFLLRNLMELLKHDPVSIALVKHRIRRIRLDLKFLRSCLKDNIEPDTEHLELKYLSTRVTNVAYEVEYVIDSIEVGMGAHWQHLFWLSELLEKIRVIKMEAIKICKEKTCNVRGHNVVQISSQIISHASMTEADEVRICLEDQEEVIIERLTRGSSNRDIISIIGMPGIGKTTLARKLYDHPKVTYYFYIRAWCSIFQVYDRRELLLGILSSISLLTDDIHEMTDEDLELKLYQKLKPNRYLIVMDDVWDTKAWNDLERSLPDDSNGSRILITSRLHDVALKANSVSEPHLIRPLSNDESWNLLELKLFHGGCPEELLEVVKEIAKSCKGLPLAIVAISGILQRTEKKQWKEIAKRVSSRVIDDPQTQCMDILQLSYKHLPDHLKACFLYFGTFLKDRDIPVHKLIRLWIAEGFIREIEPKRLEVLAEDCLMDLIGRSLVIVSKKRSKGRVKACRVHDMLRDFCLSKAKEENFLQIITRYDKPYASLDDWYYDSDFVDHYFSDPVTYERYRLCFYLKRKPFVKSTPSGPSTRSLILSATSDTNPRCSYDISFIPHHFKLLRVLDLEQINMGISFPTGIELLIQLRYLAVTGDVDSVPPSIANLWKLETFIVKGLKGKIALPCTIWCMASLRHVHVNYHVDFNLQDDKLGKFSQLKNLITFSWLLLTYGEDAEKIIRRLPNLRKLGCKFLESWDSSKKCNQLPRLDFLTQLVSLKIAYFGRALNPGKLSLPLNLKKLTLSSFRLPWNYIYAIGSLQNLEVLKLLSGAFEGHRWDMREGEFLKLKFLKLDTLNISQWNASNDHLPNLEQLVVRNCKELEGVPSAFAEISTLQIIEVTFCGQSTEESVKNIAEEGIEGLKIIINHEIQKY